MRDRDRTLVRAGVVRVGSRRIGVVRPRAELEPRVVAAGEPQTGERDRSRSEPAGAATDPRRRARRSLARSRGLDAASARSTSRSRVIVVARDRSTARPRDRLALDPNPPRERNGATRGSRFASTRVRPRAWGVSERSSTAP
jgi:hypothetical protein